MSDEAPPSDDPTDDAAAVAAEDQLPSELPLLPLSGAVLFPLAVMPVLIGKDRSIELVDAVMKGPRMVVVARQRDPAATPEALDEMHRIGTVATIHQLKRVPGGPVQLVLQGIARVRLDEITQTDPYLVARISRAREKADDSVALEAATRTVRDLFKRLVGIVTELPDPVGEAIEAIDDPRDVAYIVSFTAPFDDAQRQDLLETEPVSAKLRMLVHLLQHEISVRELGKKIQSETQERMSDAQRKYFLREQLRTIQKELGEEEGAETRDLRERLAKAPLPPEARKEADRELERLERMSGGAPESSVIRTFLEWLVELPWETRTETEIDVQRAQEVLDEDHYGLDEVKDRIVEYLAVRKLRRERGLEDGEQGRAEPILCFVGPPGVGKTSLGRSIGRAVGRRFARISLGGVHDESEIRGHRRTYIGAMPGRIIQSLRRVGSADPVFMLDEMDKLGQGMHGDPSAALLEVLDPAQNGTFTDTYLGVPFDLSSVFFIATANTAQSIPRPLLDRMEVVDLPGYILQEKLEIARRYLLPKQRAAHALTDEEMNVGDEALRTIAHEYTREAGVRQLDRTLARLCRKIAREIGSGGKARVEVRPEDLEELLGRPRYIERPPDRVDRPGVVTGLAWTPMGGELLFVEAALIPGGSGRLTLTGSLGDVMKESAQAALTLVRANAERLGLDAEVFAKNDIHIHVPSGAIPKDGPSAGITMVTALASAATGRLARSDIAMTGEITLRGKVTPVGGLREKILAAHRAGIHTVILPKWNERDFEDVPENLRDQMTVVPADTIEDVLKVALETPDA